MSEGETRVRRGPRKWSEAVEAIFFAELAATANVVHSAAMAGVSTSAVHARRGRDPAFAAEWLRALDAGYAELELLMLQRAREGSERVETVRDADGAVVQTKTVRFFEPGVALRLLHQHRETVERHRERAAAVRSIDDPQAAIRIRAELDRVRARLLEGPADD